MKQGKQSRSWALALQAAVGRGPHTGPGMEGAPRDGSSCSRGIRTPSPPCVSLDVRPA